jgi:hypothetical protein
MTLWEFSMQVQRREPRHDLIAALRFIFRESEPERLAEQTAAWLDDDDKRAVERFRHANASEALNA